MNRKSLFSMGDRTANVRFMSREAGVPRRAETPGRRVLREAPRA
jgi:hypothetical protein